MKKIIALFVLFATVVTASAQIKFGVKGGLNVTDMSLSKDVLSTSNRTGFFIGPTVNFTLPVVGLGIDASALYDQRSAKLSDEDGSATAKQQSVVIPLNLRYGIGLGSMASIYLFAGPQFGFNVGSKDQNLGADTSWKLKDSNFSVNVGAGVMLLKHLQVSANYNIACGKTGEITFRDGAESAFNGRNNAWQIAAAYYF